MTHRRFDKPDDKLTFLGFGQMLLPIIAEECMMKSAKAIKKKPKNRNNIPPKKTLKLKQKSFIISFIRRTQIRLKKAILRL